MNLLLVAATEAEIAPTLDRLSGNPGVTVCITGVGISAATFSLTRALLSENYQAVIAAGIAGSFDRNLPLGTVCRITTDTFGDLGVEDHENFLTLPDLGFATEAEMVFHTPVPDFLWLPPLPQKESITVHTATGSHTTAHRRFQRFGPVLESMEGAAFHYVCSQLFVPLLHLRAVSNYAEVRNREAWNVGLALKNLNNFLQQLLLPA